MSNSYPSREGRGVPARGRLAIDDDNPPPQGRKVRGRRQAARAGPDHDHVCIRHFAWHDWPLSESEYQRSALNGLGAHSCSPRIAGATTTWLHGARALLLSPREAVRAGSQVAPAQDDRISTVPSNSPMPDLCLGKAVSNTTATPLQPTLGNRLQSDRDDRCQDSRRHFPFVAHMEERLSSIKGRVMSRAVGRF